METLIEAIRVALLPDATDDAKHQGALACRTILTALETKEGEPLAKPSDTAAAQPTLQVAAMVGALRALPPEQLLDLAIARLRAALPADTGTPTVAPIKFQLIPIEPLATAVVAKGGGQR
jgi:hypothetical protein